MSLPARDRLARALDRIAEQRSLLVAGIREERESERSYPCRFGAMLGRAGYAADMLEHYVAAAREALADLRAEGADAEESAS